MNSVKDFTASSIGTKAMTDADRPIDDQGNVNWDRFDAMRKRYPICFDHQADMISFKMMTKPASEGGSGAQLTDLIEVALHQLKYLNEKFPCYENEKTIEHIFLALMWQKDRTEKRKLRGVEGKNLI